MKKLILAFVLLFTLIGNIVAQASLKLQQNWWQPNGQVSSIVRKENTIFIGGFFTYVGPQNKNLAIYNINTNEPAYTVAKPNGTVWRAIGDGDGGWYIAGTFTQIGNQNRSGLARINADGSLHAWNPSISGGTIRDMVFYNHTLFIGGSFTTVNSTTRSRICAIDTNGNITTWNPNANNDVNVMSIHNNKLYVGGSFTNIGGQNRNRLAELDITTGNSSAWNPNVNQAVLAMAPVDNKIYIGGDFSTVGSTSRSRLACVSLVTGTVTAFTGNTDATVTCLLFSQGTLFVGGIFTTVNANSKKSIFAMDTAGAGTVNGFNISSTYEMTSVMTIREYANRIYCTGPFIEGIKVFSRTGSYLTNNQIAVSSATVHDVYIDSVGKSIIAGSFGSAGGKFVNGLAAIDGVNGQLKYNWNGTTTSAVTAMDANDSILFIVERSPTNQLRGLRISDGSPTTLSLSNVSNITLLKQYQNKLYVSGNFSTINSISRSDFAVINLATNNVDAFTLNTNSRINDISFRNDTAYCVGAFTLIGGITRNNIASFNINSATVYSWNPNANAEISSLVLKNNSAFVGGNYTSIGGAIRNRLAEIDLTSGNANSWNPNANAKINSMALLGDSLFVGGDFTNIAAQNTRYVTCFLTSTGNTVPSRISNRIVTKVYKDANYEILSGFLDSIDNQQTGGLAVLMNTCKALTTFTHNKPLCSGDTIQLFTQRGNEYSYQWLLNNAPVINSNSWNIKSVNSGLYRAVVQNNTLSCADTSAAIQITVNPKSLANLKPATDTTFCSGNPSSIILSVDSGALVTNIRWLRNNLLLTPRTDSLTVTQTGQYKSVVTNIFECIDTSKTIQVTINSNPTAFSIQASSSVICNNDSLLLRIPRPLGSITYQWKFKGNFIPGATDTFYFAKDSGRYEVVFTNASGCTSTSARSILKGITPNIQIADIGGTQLCTGQTTLLYYKDSANKPLNSYRWLRNGSLIIPLISSASYTVTTSAVYSLVGTSASSCRDTSNAIQVIINPKPAGIGITGNTLVVSGTTHAYDVISKPLSTYTWLLSNGTQMSGNNTASITVRWGAAGAGLIRVVETDSVGCKGDTAEQNIGIEAQALLLDKSSITLSNTLQETFPLLLETNLNWTSTSQHNWYYLDKTSGSAGINPIDVIVAERNNTGTTRQSTITFSAGTLQQTLTIIQPSTNVGINESSAKNHVFISPNPSNGNIVLVNPFNNTIDIKIYSVDGKQVGAELKLAPYEKLNLPNQLAKGIYFVWINEGNEEYTIKHIVGD